MAYKSYFFNGFCVKQLAIEHLFIIQAWQAYDYLADDKPLSELMMEYC